MLHYRLTSLLYPFDNITAQDRLIIILSSGYTMMVHGRGCNPHCCTTTFANVEITSLWRHWWRHKTSL